MTTAIVLAAGSSLRMGVENKLTLPYSGSTILETTVDQLLASNIDEIIVVLGHEQEYIKQLLEKRKVKFCYNPNHLSGMTSSIQTGVKAASKTSKGYLICLSDMPFLTTADYNHILKLATDTKEILLPFFENEKGNPVFFSKHFKGTILNHKTPEGCKNIVQNNKSFLKKVIFNNDHILRDIDTLKEYKNI